MKVRDIKAVIKECVAEAVKELKQEFEHIETKGSLNKGKPASPEGVDAGDKKMGPTERQSLSKVPRNDVSKVKDEKGRMNQTIRIDNSVNKVKEQTGRMKEANALATKDAPVVAEKKQKQEKKEDMKEATKTNKKKFCESCGANLQAKSAAPMAEDVAVNLPLPAGSENAEVSAEIIPGEQGQEAIAELIIVDDQVTPESIDNDMIEIEIPDGSGLEDVEGLEGMESPDAAPEREVPEMDAPEGMPGAEPEAEDGDEFDRFADLAGTK